MPGKVVMVQGTASSVGKSILVAALCRILRQDGWNVAPFKAQNMSLNSFVTADGKEMGRAQVVQAEAAVVEPHVDMNPILLKPEADNRSQVVVMGVPVGGLDAVEYYSRKKYMWAKVTEALDRLRSRYDVIVIEGAGSPAEINLKDKDIVNMAVARYCRAPVLLVGNIDLGGVFASLVGTLELLDPEERALVRAFVINKFRGDLSLLTPGLTWLEERTRIPVAGVVPYFKDIRIPEEDSVPLERRLRMNASADYLLDIAVIGFPNIANFDDFDPLEQESGIRLRYVEPNDRLGNPDLVILPGTKSTIADLAYLRETGLDREIATHARYSAPVIGICGGYQMLGKWILDPRHVESDHSRAQGLGLLPLTTVFTPDKSTHQIKGRVAEGRGILRGAAGLPLRGYEIHMGQTSEEGESPPFVIEGRSGSPGQHPDGAMNSEGNILGTYIHGLFHNEGLRRAILSELARRKGVCLPPWTRVSTIEDEYDKLADLVRGSLDMHLVYRIMGIDGT
jgi:adenosylcobyric acid synthase